MFYIYSNTECKIMVGMYTDATLAIRYTELFILDIKIGINVSESIIHDNKV